MSKNIFTLNFILAWIIAATYECFFYESDTAVIKCIIIIYLALSCGLYGYKKTQNGKNVVKGKALMALILTVLVNCLVILVTKLIIGNDMIMVWCIVGISLVGGIISLFLALKTNNQIENRQHSSPKKF